MGHKTRGRIWHRFVILFAAISVLLPMLLIALWSIVWRWPWPNLLPEGFSARGLQEVFGSHSQARGALFSSVWFSLLAAVLSVFVSYLAARAFAFYEFKGKPLLRFLGLLPILIPANVFAMGAHVLFLRAGLGDSVMGVLICHVLYALPYTLNILTGSMEANGARYEHQAAVLGCSPIMTAFHVTLPLLLPALLTALCMGYVISFSQYFITLLIGGGLVKTFSMIMVPFIAGGDRTIASAYVVLFLLSSLVVFTLFEAVAKLILGKGRSQP